jgi:hypothetical protein
MIPARIRHRLLHRLRSPDSWVMFFVMGFIMLNFPFLGIFNKPVVISGFPLMFLYLYIGWGFSILVIYIFTSTVSPGDEKKHENRKT